MAIGQPITISKDTFSILLLTREGNSSKKKSPRMKWNFLIIQGTTQMHSTGLCSILNICTYEPWFLESQHGGLRVEVVVSINSQNLTQMTDHLPKF